MYSKLFKLMVGCLILMAVATIISACQNQNQTEPKKIKIGFVAPLTGDASNSGIPTKQAAELAVEEINTAGGINGNPIEMISEDGQCDSKQGLLAGNKLIGQDRVSAIVGGFCSGETMAIAPMAEANKVIMLSPASSNPKISTMGDYIFRDFPADNFQGNFAAEFVYNQLQLKKVAILNCQADYCAGLKDVFKNRFVELGGQIVSQQQFESETNDLKTQLIKIKESGAELIYAPSYPQAALILSKQAGELNIDLPVLGGDIWDDPSILGQHDDSGKMLWTTTQLNVPGWFKDKMREKYGLAEVPNYAPQAYDAVNILALVMKKVGTNPEDIKNQLYKIKNYPGVSGTISFDANGDLESATYIVKTIQDGRAVTYTQK